MKILFWLEPTADYQMPGRYAWWGDQLLRIDSSLDLALEGYESALISFEAYDSESVRNYRGRWIRLAYQEIYACQEVGGDIDNAHRSETAGRGLADLIVRRLGEFRPDVVFIFSEFPALKIALSDAAFINIEFSWFSRHLFPEYYQLDLYGRGKARFLAENIDVFTSRALSVREKQFLNLFRRRALKAVSNKESNDLIAALRSEFGCKRLVLLPLAERYVLDGRTPIAVGLDHLLARAPRDYVFLVTTHPGENCLNAFELAWLEKKYSNIRFCRHSSIHTASLFPEMDAVVGDFSSVALYGLIFNVPIVSVLHWLPVVNDFFLSRNPLAAYLEGQKQGEQDLVLLSLLLNSTLPPKKLFDGAWLACYLHRVVSCKRSGELKEIFNEPFMSVEEWLEDPWLEVDRQMDTWLGERTLKPVQKKLIQDWSVGRGSASLLVCILAGKEDSERLQCTLGSLFVDDFHLAVECVILGDEELSISTRPGIQFVRATSAEYASRLNDLMRESRAGWVMLVSAGDTFIASGLHMLGLELAGLKHCEAVYADELMRNDGSLGAVFRPDFNLDLLLSLPCAMSKHWLFRRDTCLLLGGYDPAFGRALEFELIVRLIEEKGVAGIGHLSEPLLIAQASQLVDIPDEVVVLERHLQRRGYPNGSVVTERPGRYRLIYGHAERPLVSIVIPTKDQLVILQRCVESLLERTAYVNYEVLIVDNGSETAEALAWLAAIEAMGEDKVRVLRYPHPFNYSAINNMAARKARGEYLVLLNNDTAVIDGLWIDCLINHALRPEVGIVGAKLLYPGGQIQHAGVVLGLGGPGDHAFIGEPNDVPGYMQRLQVDQNYSAVTAACLMVRKSIYEQVGGFEETLSVSYNDVDFCLKVREAGYLLVWTPYAVVMHEGSVSQSKVDKALPAEKRKRFVAEQDAMYAKWLPQLARDPAYNLNFSLDIGGGFALAPSHLTWRPLSALKHVPTVLAHAADHQGCGHYRILHPLAALRSEGMVEGTASDVLLSVSELERYNPDSIILQRQISEKQLECMRRMKNFSGAFKVYELDDYLPNLPLKSAHRGQMPKDVMRSLRRGLSYVDRFVVSTTALAEAFAGLHEDIQVVPNTLESSWWNNLVCARRRGKKPRVGWAGGAGHAGDLELIVDVVKELANEVEWIFLGMCPDKLRPYIHEVHHGVEINLYPGKLASLDLDLALAPLERNLFNECKSNLRLLEYGACGFPVICSDISCYQDGLPVTRVKNRFKDWVDAIRMHLSDLDSTALAGDHLRERVLSEWMLSGDNLTRWKAAWLP